MGKSLDIVVAVLRAVGLIIVAIVVIYIVLAVGGANPANGLVSCFQHAAGALSLGTVDLFVLKNPKISIGVNYGIAGVIWLIITALVVWLVPSGDNCQLYLDVAPAQSLEV